MSPPDQHDTFQDWITAHAGILHKVARSYCERPADREDLLQEIQLAIWHAIPAFQGGSRVSSYLYRIALNRAISWVRRESSQRRRHEKLAAEPVHVAPEPEDPRLALIYAEIRRLNKIERALILLQLDGFSYDEIATALGLTATNVGARLTRIRQKLATNLKDQ
ncbi:RNA polymerase sigma factor [Actomonas aquatica]|uniref:RNA polymerase sigma factor n=1 Tax=Actomonas aquatica TaxID=2866162 RepID=A0ABZ1CC11_9BACT|nr:RNA polymerase sigma factor [Opitutus sp. WL0086]WRQ89218.1 RNA polymerase sigma factor [Opitutus sp. WL0086]